MSPKPGPSIVFIAATHAVFQTASNPLPRHRGRALVEVRLGFRAFGVCAPSRPSSGPQAWQRAVGLHVQAGANFMPSISPPPGYSRRPGMRHATRHGRRSKLQSSDPAAASSQLGHLRAARILRNHGIPSKFECSMGAIRAAPSGDTPRRITIRKCRCRWWTTTGALRDNYVRP